MTPTYSVCATYYRRLDHLKRFLTSLRRYPPNEPWELIVAGSALGMDDQDEIESLLEPFRHVAHVSFPRRVSVTLCVNANVLMSRGEYLIMCNDDIEFIEPGWAERLRDALAGSDVIAAGGCALNENTAIPTQIAVKEGGVRRVEDIAAFLWIVPRYAFSAHSVGLLNHYGWYGYEDTDWCHRATQLFGKRLVVTHDVVVKHHTEHAYDGKSVPGIPDIIDSTIAYRKRRALGLCGY